MIIMIMIIIIIIRLMIIIMIIIMILMIIMIIIPKKVVGNSGPAVHGDSVTVRCAVGTMQAARQTERAMFVYAQCISGGSHLSNTAYLPKVSSKVANNVANYGDP